MDKPPKAAKADHKAIADNLAREAADKGALVELGFRSLAMMAWPGLQEDSVQYQDLRAAFFAGGQHVFGAITQMMEAGDEPTPADLDRMSRVADELQRFIEAFEAKHNLRATVATPRNGRPH